MGGNPSKQKNQFGISDYGYITIHTDKTAFIPGETVTGKIYLHAFKPFSSTELSLGFYGLEELVLSDGSENFEKREKHITNSTWSLYKWGYGLSAGHYEIPFSFMLPSELPASFHQEGYSFWAHITYKLEAYLKSDDSWGNIQTVCQQRSFVVRQPIEKEADSYTEEKQFALKTWGILSRGSLTIKAHFDKNILLEGGDAQASLEVDNMVGKLSNTQVTFQLVQVLRFVETRFPETKYKLPIAKKTVNGITTHNSGKFDSLSFTLPTFHGDEHNVDKRTSFRPQRSTDQYLGKLSSVTKGKYISSEFLLEISCKMKGFLATTPKITCPVSICVRDPNPQVMNLPADWNPEVVERVDLGLAALVPEKSKIKVAKKGKRKKIIKTEMVEQEECLLKLKCEESDV